MTMPLNLLQCHKTNEEWGKTSEEVVIWCKMVLIYYCTYCKSLLGSVIDSKCDWEREIN